jgi:hypothetical protein
MEALAIDRQGRQMSNWNDDRLDTLAADMKDGFARVDQQFARVDERFEQVASREEMGEVKAQMNRLNDRIGRVMYTMMATGVGMVGTVLVGVVGLILKA